MADHQRRPFGFLGEKKMRKTTILGSVALLALTGCTTDEPPVTTPVPTPRHLDAARIETPLDSFLPSKHDALILHQAEARLINQCLNELGYTKNPIPEPESIQQQDRHSEFIVFPVSQAEQHGYNSPAPATPKGSSWDDRASTTQQELIEGKLRRYKGKDVPEGGCSRVAADRITKGTKVPKQITGGGVVLDRREQASPTGLSEAHVEVLRLEAIFKASKDTKISRMTADWSSCMSKKGHQYRSPQEAANDDRWAGDDVTHLEKRTAVADMECKQQVNYLGVMVSVQSAYEREIMKQRENELADLRSNTKAWTRNAARVMSQAK